MGRKTHEIISIARARLRNGARPLKSARVKKKKKRRIFPIKFRNPFLLSEAAVKSLENQKSAPQPLSPAAQNSTPAPNRVGESSERMDVLNAIIGGLTTWSDHRREKALKKRAVAEQKKTATAQKRAVCGGGVLGSMGEAIKWGVGFAKRTAGVWAVACALIGGAGAIVENNAAQINASKDWVLVNPAGVDANAENLQDLHEIDFSDSLFTMDEETKNKTQLKLVTRESFFEPFNDAREKCVASGACQFVSLSKADWEKWQLSGEPPAAIAAAGWPSETPVLFFMETNVLTSIYFLLGVLGTLWGAGSFALSLDAAKKVGGLKPAAKILAAFGIAAPVAGIILFVCVVGGVLAEATGPATQGIRLAHPAWTATQSVLDGKLAPEKTSWSVESSNSTPEDRARLSECLRAGFCAWEEQGVSLDGGTIDVPPSATPAAKKSAEVSARQSNIARLAWAQQSKTSVLTPFSSIMTIFCLLVVAFIAPHFSGGKRGQDTPEVEKWEARLRKWIRRAQTRDTETLARVVEAAKPTER